MSDRLRRLLLVTAFLLAALLTAMLAVSAGVEWVAYAVPVVLLALFTYLWAQAYGWAWASIPLVLGALATITILLLIQR